jgi:hypothetical protein
MPKKTTKKVVQYKSVYGGDRNLLFWSWLQVSWKTIGFLIDFIFIEVYSMTGIGNIHFCTYTQHITTHHHTLTHLHTLTHTHILIHTHTHHTPQHPHNHTKHITKEERLFYSGDWNYC